MSEPLLPEESIFARALEIKSLKERAAFLDQHCGNNHELRAEVEALLRVHQISGDILDLPEGAALSTTAPFPISDSPGAIVGPYKLLQQIGEGGMGVVFMAEQSQPVKRRVALKIIKPGMDSRQVIARFEAERQALSLMDHPNIARVLDAGMTTSGRPYFVMELVKGQPITQYCDEHQLTPRQRLEILLPVCQAIQHAHQKGIIHRDIKPSNILVAEYDSHPVPKVIDFGVAKAVNQPLTDKTMFTGLGHVVGTLEYMSPEQAKVNQLDIDTRSDIYSLGVLLYELLTGSTPFDKKRLRTAALDEMLRIIREEEPPKPSTRLTDSIESLPSISAQRHTEPAKLAKMVRGELDWIVMKALEKDRNRRYETANSFAMDLQRYLADEPVLACPPSAGYRLNKFVRRNKSAVLATIVALLALVIGCIGTTIGLIEARNQRDAAETARLDESREKNRAVTAEKLASERLAQVEEERAIAQAIGDYLQKDLLGQAYIGNQVFGPDAPKRDPRITVRELVDRAEKTIAGKFVDQPLVEAALRQTLADTYSGLGEFATATIHAQRALDLRRSKLGPDHDATLESLNSLGTLNMVTGNATKAIELLQQVLQKKQAKYGPNAPATLGTKQHLALAYWAESKWPDSIALLEEVRAARIKSLGLHHLDTLRTLSILASFYAAVGNVNEALDILLHAREAISKYYSPDDPEMVLVLACLGETYLRGGRTAEAIDVFTKVHDSLVRTLNAEHPQTLSILTNLGAAYYTQGNLKLALSHYQLAAVGVEKLKFRHVNAPVIVANVCSIHEQLKQYPEAEVWLRKWLAFVKEKDGPASGPYARALFELGDNLLMQLKHVEAEPILRECLSVIPKTPPQYWPSIAWTTSRIRMQLGGALLGQKQYTDAEPLLLKGYEGMTGVVNSSGSKPPGKVINERLVEALTYLVQLYEETGKPELAARWRKELDALTQTNKQPVKSKDR